VPRLTEQEQQEIIRYIEADKPLPEKYRFLLFEDKREVELVWNGKTSEVCNIVLPFQVIEQVDEPRAEKSEDSSLQGLLFDERGRQLKGWTNKLIWGDNKLVLSSLKDGPLRWRGFFDGYRNRRRHVHQETKHPRRDCLPRHVGQGRGFIYRHDLRAAHSHAGPLSRGRQHLRPR
jgi:hypothetical protein